LANIEATDAERQRWYAIIARRVPEPSSGAVAHATADRDAWLQGIDGLLTALRLRSLSSREFGQFR